MISKYTIPRSEDIVDIFGKIGLQTPNSLSCQIFMVKTNFLGFKYPYSYFKVKRQWSTFCENRHAVTDSCIGEIAGLQIRPQEA